MANVDASRAGSSADTVSPIPLPEAVPSLDPGAALAALGSSRGGLAGDEVELGAEELVPGDLIALEAGDAVPADARVVEGHELSVEMAALTGESQPVGRTDQPVDSGTAPLDARNCVFMGTSVVRGTARAVVFATGIATELGRVYRLTADHAPEPSPLQHQVIDMARRVAAVAVSRMAAHPALVKRLAAVEPLGSTTVICVDKTGTLTKAEMTVQQVFASDRVHLVSGVGGVENLDDQLVSDDARPRRSPGRKGCCRWRRGRCSPSSWAARSRG